MWLLLRMPHEGRCGVLGLIGPQVCPSCPLVFALHIVGKSLGFPIHSPAAAVITLLMGDEE